MIWLWSFVIYSFLGFLLEVLFARLTGGRRERKSLVLLPLCPVYGLGACAILLAAPLARGNIFLMLILGTGAATAVEYGAAAWNEHALGVAFWDYTGLPGSLRGRVCLPFSLSWGALAVVLIAFLHPVLLPWMERIPLPVSLCMAVLTASDLVLASLWVRHTGDRECLAWYRGKKKASPEAESGEAG